VLASVLVEDDPPRGLVADALAVLSCITADASCLVGHFAPPPS
jgi:hypothetical protein